ncbi:MAG: hypothetical protein QXT64_01470 [Desulfurococcaceae archaeon]
MSRELKTFVDPNGRLKTARDIQVISHQIRDAINNTTFTELYVKITVVGKRRGEWVEYMPLKDFVRLNPGLAEELFKQSV